MGHTLSAARETGKLFIPTYHEPTHKLSILILRKRMVFGEKEKIDINVLFITLLNLVP